MEMVTFSSNDDEQLSQALSFETNRRSNLRDVSFSSYLNDTEEFLVLKLTESSLGTPISSPVEDGEIGVFNAEKYFNGGMDEEEEKPNVADKASANDHFIADKPAFTDPIKLQIPARTPSVHSESSCNSRSTLLQSALRHSTQRQVKKVQGKSLLVPFGCRCACADKNSVEIDEHASWGGAHGKHDIQHRTISGLIPPARVAQVSTKARENNQVNHFHKLGTGANTEMKTAFPDTVSGVRIRPTEVQCQEEMIVKPRKSIEVFGSPVLSKRNEPVSFDGRSTMLRWEEAITRAEEMDITSANCGVYTDTESDASSDLFELDSLTGKSNQYLLRQASDGLSGCVTPTTCYAPSEASIDWSVITASAADYSVMSDSEELKSTKFIADNSIEKAATTPPKAKFIPNKDVPRRVSSSFLGCKSQKAVNVAGDAYITNENKAKSSPRMRHKPEMFAPVTRFQPEAKLLGFESRNRQRHGITARPISRSYSSQGSHMLYIQ